MIGLELHFVSLPCTAVPEARASPGCDTGPWRLRGHLLTHPLPALTLLHIFIKADSGDSTLTGSDKVMSNGSNWPRDLFLA